MTPGNLFRLQIAAAFAGRRRTLLRIALTLLLALPFIFVGMPPRAQAGGIVMVMLFTTFFGSAVAHARLREDHRLERLTLLPIPRPVLWLDLTLSSTVSRLAPLALVFITFIAVNSTTVTILSLSNLLGLLLACLVLLTVLGMATGSLAHSNAEVHLFGALACGVLAFVSGLTPLPEKLTWLSVTTAANPVAMLLRALLRMTSGTGSMSGLELTLSLLTLIAVAALTVYRWAEGAAPGKKAFDHDGLTANNSPQ
jgi:hypothetical protein